MFYWVVFAGIVLILIIAVILPVWGTRRRWTRRRLRRAIVQFHRQREWLEARFWKLASDSGKPRGLRWANCDFADDVLFARDRSSGGLRALVEVTIQFEAEPDGPMTEVAAVEDRKEATIVFRLDGPQWEVDGRALFNLDPTTVLAQYDHELESIPEVMENDLHRTS